VGVLVEACYRCDLVVITSQDISVGDLGRGGDLRVVQVEGICLRRSRAGRGEVNRQVPGKVGGGELSLIELKSINEVSEIKTLTTKDLGRMKIATSPHRRNRRAGPTQPLRTPGKKKRTRPKRLDKIYKSEPRPRKKKLKNPNVRSSKKRTSILKISYSTDKAGKNQ